MPEEIPASVATAWKVVVELSATWTWIPPARERGGGAGGDRGPFCSSDR